MQDILNWTSLIANITASLGVIGFIALYLAHQQSQRQFNFAVMISCIDRFQKLIPLISSGHDNSSLKQYVDLTNEEFFYFQQNYIPKDVMVEWLDSIINYLPLYVKDESVPINFDFIVHRTIHNDSLLIGYPRLIKAFLLKESYDTAVIYNRENIGYRTLRKKLIKEIAKNLKITLKDKHFKNAFLE